MNTMEINKIVAGVICAVLLVVVVGKVGSALVSPEELEAPVYPFSEDVMAGASAPTAAPAEPAGPEPILAMLASADMGEGEKVFKKCASCHDVEKGGPNKTGPNLYGIVGAAFAHKGDFSYSDGMASHGGNWGFAELNEFLYKPRDYIDGTKMSFGGLKKAEDRAAVIAWLNTKSDNPVALPDPAAVEAAEAVDEAAEAVEEAVDDAAAAVEGAVEEAGDAVDSATAQ
ncbi:cytochrome c family protein [Thalassospira sp.]|uniref:c-type cytochrome n=1 Tax=Thalassospira sp. TaxID=1912094 RepID=UPI000C46F3F0|nr:cytochrome c family protein [Thalassospira sp.]MBC06804.1 cytochrome c family protein [Thalassospira sp.]|tara:strand:+ start:5807 stop:6490 length:684 start_codon:yes stop_codon:yes gene_type:complete